MKILVSALILGFGLVSQAGVVYQNYFGDIVYRPGDSGNVYVYRGQVYYRTESGVVTPRRFVHNVEIRNRYNTYYRHNYGYRNILHSPYQHNYQVYRDRARESVERYKRSLPPQYNRNPYQSRYPKPISNPYYRPYP